MKKLIYTRFDIPGIHYWPEAPPHLHFLLNPHRHDFKFEIAFKVTDNDRELEFFETQMRCNQQLLNLYEANEMVLNFGSESCESIAEKLLKQLPEFVVYVDVSEDGENGARVYK